jgi:hypothetical protein
MFPYLYIADIWCGYEVYGVILLHDLKGNMRLNNSRDMYVHLFTLDQLRFQCINTSCKVVMALVKRVFLRLVEKISDRFLEQ